MRSAGLVAAVLLGAALLTGCGGASPQADLRDAVADATTAANDGDADGVRSAAQRITELARAERASLGGARSDRLVALAASLDDGADQLDPALLEAQRQARERQAREQAEQAAAEKAAAEQAARDQAARDQAARDQAARDEGDRAEDKGGDDGKKDKPKGGGKGKDKD